jgi:diacylglycerol kinase
VQKVIKEERKFQIEMTVKLFAIIVMMMMMKKALNVKRDARK